LQGKLDNIAEKHQRDSSPRQNHSGLKLSLSIKDLLNILTEYLVGIKGVGFLFWRASATIQCLVDLAFQLAGSLPWTEPRCSVRWICSRSQPTISAWQQLSRSDWWTLC